MMAESSSSDGLPQLLKDLSISVEKKSEDVSGILDLIINKTLESGSDGSSSSSGGGGGGAECVGRLRPLLDRAAWDGAVVARAARLVAEMSKADEGRAACANEQLVTALVDLLRRDEQDVAVVTQVARALGNICYENDAGRVLVMAADGMGPAMSTVTRSKGASGEAGRTLRSVAVGFVLNLVLGHEEAQRRAVEAGVVPLLCSLLEGEGGAGEEETANHVMLIFGLLVESGHRAAMLDERVCRATVNVLEASTSPDLCEMCLELLHGQAEDETVKVHLAHAGVCELLFRLIEKHRPLVEDEETRNLMKMACDLIVLILTGDASMNILYAEGKGTVFEEMVSWLGSDDEDLQITGVLAMGNFARTDRHCIQMVAAGVSKKLLDLMEKNNTSAGDIRLQHALLSALRNLVIPVQNKPTVLANRLVDIVYPMLEIPTFPVVFKLLGTLRMVIDGQEEAACDLGRRAELIRRLVAWCATEDHPGVQGEANRLLAWLIKNSRNKEVLDTMAAEGAIQRLVAMVTAEHVVMQNEALLALTLLAAMRLADSAACLTEAGVGDNITKLMTDHGATLAKEIILNALSLIGQLVKSAPLKQHLREAGLSAALALLLARKEISDIHDRVKNAQAAVDAV